MKTSKFINVVLASLLLFAITSCEVVGGIFKTGMGVGVFVVIAIIITIVVVVLRLGKGRN